MMRSKQTNQNHGGIFKSDHLHTKGPIFYSIILNNRKLTIFFNIFGTCMHSWNIHPTDNMQISKTTTIIAIVAVLAIAVAGILILNNGGQGSNNDDTDGKYTEDIEYTFEYNNEIRLAIFGNVNGDDHIDDGDLKLLESILKGETTFDKKKNCFADANADGRINSKDMEVLKNIIAGKECKMSYWDCTKSIASIDYPLKGKIGTHHMYAIDALIILGLYNDVVATSHQTFQNSISTDGLRYPGMGKTIVDVGNPWENCEAAVAAGVNIWIETGSSASRDYTTYKTIANAAGLNLQVIHLYVTTYNVDATEIYGSILMLGTMFKCEDKAQKYVDWVDGVVEYIDVSKKNLDKDRTFLTPMGTDNPGKISLDTTHSNGNMMGDVYTISLTGMKSVNTVVESGCPAISLEQIYNLKPDVIVIIMFQTSDKSVETIQSEFDVYADIYKQTDAYKNGNVYGINFYNIASCAGASELVLLSSYIWPSVISEEKGWEYLQYYYDNFTMYDHVDVSKMGNALPFKMSKA